MAGRGKAQPSTAGSIASISRRALVISSLFQKGDEGAWQEMAADPALAATVQLETDTGEKRKKGYNDRIASDGSALDTVDKLDFAHIYQFVRSTLGYVSPTGSGVAPTPAPTPTRPPVRHEGGLQQQREK
ncbi:hypothetical protein HDU96_006579 [Phlyctochytrium bullatum]|nr:hypothetical protein HDU96_006579 [Phlyctochytrium bullatum]